MTNLDASPYVGRLALCRVHQGRSGAAQQIAWCRADGTIERAKVTELYVTEALDRVEAEEAGPGEIIAVAGHPRGHDRRDARRPRRPAAAAGDHGRRAVALDHHRHQHLAARRPGGRQADRDAGREPAAGGAGRQRLPARARDRAARHLGGAGPRRAPARGARRADAPRGLRAHRRQAAGRHPRRRRRACTSRSSASRSTCPRSTSASSPSCFALRKGRTEALVNHGTGWVRMDVLVPARGLIGFRTEFLTETRGTGHPAPRLRALRAVVRRAPHAADRRARRRPARADDGVRAAQPAGARLALRRPGRGGLRGHDRRRERAQPTISTSTPPRRRS